MPLRNHSSVFRTSTKTIHNSVRPLITSHSTSMGLSGSIRLIYNKNIRLYSSKTLESNSSTSSTIKARIFDLSAAKKSATTTSSLFSHQTTNENSSLSLASQQSLNKSDCSTEPSSTLLSSALKSSQNNITKQTSDAAPNKRPKTWGLVWGKPGDVVSPFRFKSCQDAVLFATKQGWDYIVEGSKNPCDCPPTHQHAM